MFSHVKPGELTAPICKAKAIPVVDLAQAEGNGRADLLHQILNASQEFGRVRSKNF